MIIFPSGEFVKYQLVITNPIFYFPKTSELPQRLKARQVIDFYQFSTDGLKRRADCLMKSEMVAHAACGGSAVLQSAM